MDDRHFDDLVKRLGAGVDRRRALRNALGGLVAAMGGAAALEAEAKRQGKDKKGKAQAKDKHKGKAQGKGKHKGQSGKELTAICVTPETCTSSTQCCDPNIPQCGTFGDTAGECCRTQIGIYCDTVANGNNCCGPNYVCAPGTTFPVTDPTHFGCQCNAADGFVQQDGGCHCLTGCIIDGKCADASHCATTTTTAAPVCVQPGGTCNACHACCAGTTCGPNNAQSGHVCDGTGGTCCIPDQSPGNINHPDLCCSGCLVGSTCADASHCATTTTTVTPTTTTTVAPTTTTTAAPCTSNADCPGKQICCGPNTDKPGQCVGHGKNEGNKACFKGKS